MAGCSFDVGWLEMKVRRWLYGVGWRLDEDKERRKASKFSIFEFLEGMAWGCWLKRPVYG